ncbi:hypothetical protein [Micromonospora sp. SH-82]|uniref:hypothetical protein n=1 Tax=Micromonospora sp. SH-82 TaxID=3132938 RepID=UPI003EBE9C0B
MPDSEMAEIHQRATATVTGAIQVAGQLAGLLIDARIAQLRRAAKAGEEQSRQLRAQARAAQQADAAVWRRAMRPEWWRTAGTEDVVRVWRAASTWQHVDPGAQQARQMVVDQLAKRTGRVPGKRESAQEPDGVEVLSDAVDRAAHEATDRPTRSAGAVRDGQERMTAEVRRAWPSGQRADKVLGCEAWDALASRLERAQRAGHDVQNLLRGVPDFVDRARMPAAFACRVVQDQLDGRNDPGARHRGHGNVQVQAAHTELSGRAVPAAAEQAGIRYAGGVEGERLRAAALAFWTDRQPAAEKIDGESTSPETIGQVTYAENRLAAYRDPRATMRVFGGEQPTDRTGILTRADSSATGSEPATRAARAFPASTRNAMAAPQTGTNPGGKAPAVKTPAAGLDSPSR